MTTSNIDREQSAIMRGEPTGAAMRLACQDFEKFWSESVKNQPRGKFINLEIEERCKNIARIAFLEGRGV